MTLKNPFQMIGHFYTDVMRFLRHPKKFCIHEHKYYFAHDIDFKSGELKIDQVFMFLFIYCKIVSSRIGFYQNDIHCSQKMSTNMQLFI